MAVTAADMAARGAKVEFQEHVDGQLKSIDAALEKHPLRWGWNVLSYELPRTFPMGLSTADCQRIVYASIIASLRDRGFDVKVRLTSLHNVLFVGWNVNITPSDASRLTSVIKSACLASDAEAERFRTKPVDPPPPPAATAPASTG